MIGFGGYSNTTCISSILSSMHNILKIGQCLGTKMCPQLPKIKVLSRKKGNNSAKNGRIGTALELNLHHINTKQHA